MRVALDKIIPETLKAKRDITVKIRQCGLATNCIDKKTKKELQHSASGRRSLVPA